MATETDRKKQLVELRSLLDKGAIDGREFDRQRRELFGLPPADEVIEVPYRSPWRLIVGALSLLGLGLYIAPFIPIGPQVIASSGMRVFIDFLAALCLAVVAVILLAAIRVLRSDGRPLVIDDNGISVQFPLRGRYAIPWSEVEGCRDKTLEGEYSSTTVVQIQLRAPLRRFRVPSREPRTWSSAHGKLGISEVQFDISNDELIELIQGHVESRPPVHGHVDPVV